MSPSTPSYAFARKPAWIATHLLVLAVVVGFVNLGLWQLRRLDERRDHNALIEARADVDPVPVGDLVDPGDGDDVTDLLRFRAVTAAGEYLPEGQIVVRSRTLDGAPGGWVVTPMVLAGGEEVAVLRGFVRTERDGSFAAAAPLPGPVEVTGTVVPVDRLDRIARTDIGGLVDTRPAALPVVVQAAASAPPDDAALTAVPLPEQDDGPHLSYAVQWFLFTAVVVAGYPFLLRRRAGDARDTGPAG